MSVQLSWMLMSATMMLYVWKVMEALYASVKTDTKGTDATVQVSYHFVLTCVYMWLVTAKSTLSRLLLVSDFQT